MKYSSEHWGDFFCYHEQNSSWYIVRFRGLARFEIFKKIGDTGGEDGDRFHRWDVTVANIRDVPKVFFSVDRLKLII